MKKKFTILVIIAALVLNLQGVSAYTYYSDVLDQWGEPYIEWATNEVNLFQGYNDHTFRPENNITRAEFMSILNRLLKAQKFNLSRIDENFQLAYRDLSKNFWAYDDIHQIAYYIENKAVKNVTFKSIFSGNNLTPNAPITRYEAGVLVSLITPPSIERLNKNYKDLSSSLRFYDEIIDLTDKGIVNGYGDGTFRPWKNITRSEAAKILKDAYSELEYLKVDQLHIRDLKDFNLVQKRPLFEYKTSITNSDAKLDKGFMDAITTLDYISFVGYIPYSERHLYDPDPIGSLWDLKNSNYYNVIGLNYYLLYYDKSLVLERKVELVKEAFEHYESLNSERNIEGMTNLMDLAKDILDPEELIPFLEKYFSKVQNINERILAGTILAEQYLKNNQYSEALDTSRRLIGLTNHMEVKAHLVLNNAYLIYKNTGQASAIDYLNRSWKSMKEDINYRKYEENIDFSFISMIKQLMMK